jgi:hypothetical protein
MENKFAENDLVQLWTENKILYWEFKSEKIINAVAANQILELLSLFCQEERYLILQDMTNLQWLDKRARDIFAADKTINNMLAIAHYSAVPFHKIIYSIYLLFSKPTVVSDFFDDKGQAIAWLKSMPSN